jgi:YVTN family beta-propeller protein
LYAYLKMVSLLLVTTSVTVIGPMIAPISTGAPVAPAGSPACTPKVYVANTGDTISVIDTSTNTVSVTIPGGSRPVDVAITPDGRKALVTNLDGGDVTVIDTITEMATSTVPVGSEPTAITFTPDGTRAYVTDQADGTVSVIDLDVGAVTATIPVGNTPLGIAITPDGTTAYVANSNDSDVSVIDTATGVVTSTIVVGTVPYGVAASPDGTKVYVDDFDDAAVSVITVATGAVTATIPVGTRPSTVAFTPDGTEALVTNFGGATVSVIDRHRDRDCDHPHRNHPNRRRRLIGRLHGVRHPLGREFRVGHPDRHSRGDRDDSRGIRTVRSGHHDMRNDLTVTGSDSRDSRSESDHPDLHGLNLSGDRPPAPGHRFLDRAADVILDALVQPPHVLHSAQR